MIPQERILGTELILRIFDFEICSSVLISRSTTLSSFSHFTLNYVNQFVHVYLCVYVSRIELHSSHDASDGNGTTRWQEVTIPRAHQDSIWRISWSHPEFGQLFASCSQDKTVHIWEEQEGVSKSENRDKWIRKMQLSDSKGSVNDVKFGPRHVGLKVAAGSADGCIRIYEATDVFALNYWSLQSTLVANDGGIGVGADESSVNCLSWNECPFEPPYMVAGYSFGAILWAERGGKWTEEMKLSQDRPVYDIAWAAGMGRSYHLIAAVDRTKTFKVYKVRRESEGKLVYDSCMEVEAPSSVWRVAWNATGTVLATSTESGDLDLWRRDFKGNTPDFYKLTIAFVNFLIFNTSNISTIMDV